jgi:hypothetical protein
MSSVAEQLHFGTTLPIEARLPLDPRALQEAHLEPLARGRLYNLLDLDSWQRACVEEALRMVAEGIYRGAER